MSFLTIPVDGVQPDHQFSIELDKVIFVLRFRFNSRANRWTFDVSQEDGTLLLAGIPLVTSFPLLLKYKNENLPLGDFFVIDSTGANAEATEDSWNATHFLVYKEALNG